MKIHHSEPYGRLRLKAYPPVGQQLDAVFRMAQALQAQGFVLPDQTRAWMDTCQAVKERYAKTLPADQSPDDQPPDDQPPDVQPPDVHPPDDRPVPLARTRLNPPQPA